MKHDFATAMRRSLEQTRAGDPLGATRTIRTALTDDAGATSPLETPPPRQEKARRENQRLPLSKVISELSRKPSGLDFRFGRSSPVLDVPAGAAFEHRHHQGTHGARDYRVYRPANQHAPVKGVLLMLHGCTQSPEDFAVGTRMNEHAERHAFVVVYPEQTRGHNASLCWNWFRPGDQGRSEGEPALLAELVAAIASEHGVPPSRTFAAGLSAGGAMAAILSLTHPEVFAAVGVHSGLAPGSAQDMISAFSAMRGEAAPGAKALSVPAIIFHGSADKTVAPVNAGRLAGPVRQAETWSGETKGRRYDVLSARGATGHPVEVWRIDGAGHTWSGGHADGSHTDPSGPDASAEMVRFFLAQV